MHLVAYSAGLLVAGVLLLCPGYALITLLRPRWGFGFVETLCAATGLSLAVAPLVLYVATYVGAKLTPAVVALLLLAAAVVSLWDLLRRFSKWRRSESRKVDPIYLSLGAVFALTLLSRLWMVRGVQFPLWTDSYHHTVITQLIADLGTVPSSYEPYAPIERYTYHFGFHTLSAWFHWLSGNTVPRSVVLVGQFVNALAVPTLYLFAYKLCGNRVAGLVAASIPGLVSHMPAYFVNWGRYPQLTGQVLLPALLAITMEGLKPEESRPRLWVLGGIGAAGLFLVHMRVFLWYCVFVCLWLLWRLVDARRKKEHGKIKRLLGGGAVIGIVALLPLTPWILRFFGSFGGILAGELREGYDVERYGTYFRWRTQDLAEFGAPIGIWLLAGTGALVGVARRNAGILMLIVWALLVFVGANTHVVGILPMYSSLVASISLYLPTATLVGYLAGELAALVRRVGEWHRFPSRALEWCVAIGVVAVCMAGMHRTVELIDLSSGFVRDADLEAMRWIERNTPEDALFHISTHFWTPVVAHGLDAGYWIPLLAHREATVPLQTYASDASPEYRELVNRRARDLLAAETPERLSQTMAEYGVTHVYVGNRPTDLEPNFLLGDPSHFRVVYSEDGAWVFEAAP